MVTHVIYILPWLHTLSITMVTLIQDDTYASPYLYYSQCGGQGHLDRTTDLPQAPGKFSHITYQAHSRVGLKPTPCISEG